MSWYKTSSVCDKWKNIQGFINATSAQLYFDGKLEELKEYAATLTEDQRRQARSHLVTRKQIKKQADKKNERRNNNT